MNKRSYYSVRTGINENSMGFSLGILKRLVKSLYIKLEEEGCFQEHFGYDCVDAGFVPGSAGNDIEAVVLMMLRKDTIWPIQEKIDSYSEDDVFDVIEFLYDHVSEPVDGDYHSFSNCGWHYHTFNQENGQREFREEVNGFLKDYSTGCELSEDGEIQLAAQHGFESLLDADLPDVDEQNVNGRIEAAIRKFRNSRSSWAERRDAIRDLADVLEYLRPRMKEVLHSKDENDLFDLANRFGIRHHRMDQKTDYDKPIFYSWMFYYYLATIHAAVRLIERPED